MQSLQSKSPKVSAARHAEFAEQISQGSKLTMQSLRSKSPKASLLTMFTGISQIFKQVVTLESYSGKGKENVVF